MNTYKHSGACAFGLCNLYFQEAEAKKKTNHKFKASLLHNTARHCLKKKREGKREGKKTAQ